MNKLNEKNEERSENMSLSIEKYKSEEIKNKYLLSNMFIRAFIPKLFESGGFPTRVTEEKELVRYIDSMHINSFENYYNNLCEGITNEEFELLKKTTQDIYDFTKEKYNSKFLVKAPIIASICERRIIDAVINCDKEKKIFEIGGGSGILGCLLLEEDRKYISTDVTEAFYLIQNRLYNYIINGNVNEVVSEEIDLNSKCIHIPYWKMLETKDNPLDCDIVISNHALLEMSPNSIRFYLNYFKKSLYNHQGYLVFQGGGWDINQSLIDLIKLFDEYGYNLQYFNHSKEIAAFSVYEKESCKSKVISALESLMKNAETEKIYGLGDNTTSKLNNDKIYYTSDLGFKIHKYLDIISKKEKIDYNDLEKFYNKFADVVNSPDEEFSKYIESRR